MKVKLVTIALFCCITSAWSEGNEVLLAKVTKLQRDLKSASHPEQTLYDIGESAQQIDISLEEYNKNRDFKEICHLKVIKSENFGDFVSYDGYHYHQLISKYPQSSLVDDAAYRLVYIIDTESYNYEDLEQNKQKLEIFIKKYPKSNFYGEANEKINSIEKILKSGGLAIYD